MVRRRERALGGKGGIPEGGGRRRGRAPGEGGRGEGPPGRGEGGGRPPGEGGGGGGKGEGPPGRGQGERGGGKWPVAPFSLCF